MKKILLISILGFSLVMVSCKKDLLNITPTDRISDATLFSDANLVEALVNNNYRDLTYGFYNAHWQAFLLAGATDETQSAYESYIGVNIINKGLLNSSPTGASFTGVFDGNAYPRYQIWASNYKYISQCNSFFENVDKVQHLTTENKNRLIGEMKTLRAFRYFTLVKHYGGVPLITKTLGLKDKFDASRNTVDECFKFIIDELNAAIAILPDVTAQLGKIDKGVAMAVKSRVLLYYASPLFNAGNNTALWQNAADAAQAVIDLNRYSLVTWANYKNMFIKFDPANAENIFVTINQSGIPSEGHQDDYPWPGLTFEYAVMPFVRGGNVLYAPTQQMVDSYETLDGKLITDPTSNYDPQHPYTNRDPRLDIAIYHQGSRLNNSMIDFTNPGGTDYDGDNNVTGYLLAKFVDPSVYDNTGIALGAGQGNQPWINIRYAEILLNYAEAINEAQGPANAYVAINKIRARAGIPALPSGLSQSQMKARIQNERKVELVFEEHRFWDVRRWKIAAVTNNITTQGVFVTKDGNGFSHYVYGVPNTGGNLDYDPVRIFKDPDNYFFPIPLSEIAVDPNLTQNPGY